MDSQHQTSRLSITLGKTVSEKLIEVRKIKDAMASAILGMVAEDIAAADDPNFIVYQSIYCEAKFMEHLLQEL